MSVTKIYEVSTHENKVLTLYVSDQISVLSVDTWRKKSKYQYEVSALENQVSTPRLHIIYNPSKWGPKYDTTISGLKGLNTCPKKINIKTISFTHMNQKD